MSAARAAGDRAAQLERLYRSTRTEVLAYLLRRTPLREDAADVLGEVYLVAWRHIDDVPDGNEARLWLYGVARRTVANHRRRGATVRGLAERLRDELRTSDIARVTPDLTDATTAAVHDALGMLDPDPRELLTLTAWEQLTPSEIATMTGDTPGSVRVRLHRARAQLRLHLARLGIVVNDEPERLLVER